MDGATNVTIPNQTHVQTCTSAESFVEYYKFLTGKPPTHDIVRQHGRDRARRPGAQLPAEPRACRAPTVEVWPVDGNGKRTATSPVASVTVTDGSTGGGGWGPVTVRPASATSSRSCAPALPTLHLYYEPFVRSDYTLRLLESDADPAYAGNRPGQPGRGEHQLQGAVGRPGRPRATS